MKSAHILLLEPNQLIAKQCMSLLSRRGFDVTWTKNAQDAINAADKHKPDIVILELLLAAHSGVEFLYEFRSYSEWRHIPVVIFSRIPRSGLSASDHVLAELGVSLFLYKPETSLNRLYERIDMLLPKVSAGRV